MPYFTPLYCGATCSGRCCATTALVPERRRPSPRRLLRGRGLRPQRPSRPEPRLAPRSSRAGAVFEAERIFEAQPVSSPASAAASWPQAGLAAEAVLAATPGGWRRQPGGEPAPRVAFFAAGRAARARGRSASEAAASIRRLRRRQAQRKHQPPPRVASAPAFGGARLAVVELEADLAVGLRTRIRLERAPRARRDESQQVGPALGQQLSHLRALDRPLQDHPPGAEVARACSAPTAFSQM